MPATTLPMWTREGTCQPQRCGSACCRFLVLDVNPIYLHNADVATWVRLHGIALAEQDGRVLARIPLPCLALDDRGRCELHERPERPRLCGDFPQAPAALNGLDGACTYTFKEAG